MTKFSPLRMLAMFAATLLAASFGVSAQTVNGGNCPGATVTFSSSGFAITVPAGCGGTTAISPVITAYSPPNGTAGATYASYTFMASGSPSPTWTATGLPSGLALSTAGVLTGLPSTAGASSVTVTATNAAGSDSKTFTLTVDTPTGPPTITSVAPPAGTQGQNYNFTFTASGAIPLTWTPPTGLPAGMTATQATGSNVLTLSGVPGQAATFPITVAVANSVSTTSQSYNLVINPPATISITAQSPPAATVGTPYSYPFQASGATGLTWSVATGAPPAGLTLGSSGVLSGTPTTAGTSTFTVTTTNGSSSATSGSLSITVSAAASCTGDSSIDDGCIPEPTSKSPFVLPARTPGKLAGAGVNAYAAQVTSCANANGQVGASAAVNRLWQHNIDLAAYRNAQPIEYISMQPNEALTYRFFGPSLPVGTNSVFGSIGLDENTVAKLAPTMMSISTTPCDFDVTKLSSPRDYCYTTATTANQINLEIKASGPATYLGYCAIRPGQKYYFNMRFLNAAPVSGNLQADSCAAAGVSTCGGVMQIR